MSDPEPELEWPAYITVHQEDDDDTVRLSTNCATVADARRLLSMALFNLADDVEWEDA